MKKLFLIIGLLLAVIAAGCGFGSDDAPAKKEVKNISFIVYRIAEDGSEKLVPEKITMQDNGKSVPENALLALLTVEPKAEKMAKIDLPEGAALKSLKIAADGTAYVDFNKEIVKHKQGSYDEFMLTGSIVNTLTEFPEIKQVQFLVEGEKVYSFGGHMDLEDPLQRNTTLLKK